MKVDLTVRTSSSYDGAVAALVSDQVASRIAKERSSIGVLETEWQHVASPERVQQLAQTKLGMADTSSAQLSSFEELPRRGADPAPLNNTPLHNASAQIPATPESGM